MFRRSSHIAVTVPADQVDAAVEHYKRVFGATEWVEDDGSVGIKGENFTVWVDREGRNPVAVLQEWVVADRESAMASVLAAGAMIVGESSCGFYVQDPYGLAYHVYVEDNRTPE